MSMLSSKSEGNWALLGPVGYDIFWAMISLFETLYFWLMLFLAYEIAGGWRTGFAVSAAFATLIVWIIVSQDNLVYYPFGLFCMDLCATLATLGLFLRNYCGLSRSTTTTRAREEDNDFELQDMRGDYPAGEDHSEGEDHPAGEDGEHGQRHLIPSFMRLWTWMAMSPVLARVNTALGVQHGDHEQQLPLAYEEGEDDQQVAD